MGGSLGPQLILCRHRKLILSSLQPSCVAIYSSVLFPLQYLSTGLGKIPYWCGICLATLVIVIIAHKILEQYCLLSSGLDVMCLVSKHQIMHKNQEGSSEAYIDAVDRGQKFQLWYTIYAHDAIK